VGESREEVSGLHQRRARFDHEPVGVNLTGFFVSIVGDPTTVDE